MVTGGAIRVGKAIALGLAQAGADVVIAYHTSVTEAQATVAENPCVARPASPSRPMSRM